jgi:putative endonuclease
LEQVMASKQSLGRWGEALAASYLEGQGYTVLEQNARTSYGELDLVTRKGTATVFVEVKTRTSSRYGLPEASITRKKREHLLASAMAYLQLRPELDGDWQVDVISIERNNPQCKPIITHFENVLG